jgi:hypothetical protein
MSAWSFNGNKTAYTGKEDELRAILLRFVLGDKLIGVCIGKVQSRACSLDNQHRFPLFKGWKTYPMTEKPFLDILLFKWSSQEGITPQEDLGLAHGPRFEVEYT